MVTFSPSTKPLSLRPNRNAATCGSYFCAEVPLIRPITGMACCARAATGVNAAPPRRAMNSLASFDHLVGASGQGERHGEGKLFGDSEVQEKLHLCRQVNG